MGANNAARVSVLVAAALLAPPSAAIAPALLMLIKQMAQQSITSMVKDTLISSIGGTGCKGMALQSALAGGGRGVLPGLPGGMGLPTMPAGMTVPGMGIATPGAGMAMRGFPAGADIPPEMADKLAAMMPGGMPGGGLPAGASPDMAAAMARMQLAMAQPLSPAETLATLDELSELGMLPASMRTELTECMTLIPSAGPALGMGMSMLKPMIPQMRQARTQLYALSPEEQDEVAAQIAQEARSQPADQRAGMLEYIDSGFLPPRISTGVKARLGAR